MSQREKRESSRGRRENLLIGKSVNSKKKKKKKKKKKNERKEKGNVEK